MSGFEYDVSLCLCDHCGNGFTPNRKDSPKRSGHYQRDKTRLLRVNAGGDCTLVRADGAAGPYENTVLENAPDSTHRESVSARAVTDAGDSTLAEPAQVAESGGIVLEKRCRVYRADEEIQSGRISLSARYLDHGPRSHLYRHSTVLDVWRRRTVTPLS